jgi:hypothetical protein
MSDASGQGEQEQTHGQAPAVGENWGDDISDERKAALEAVCSHPAGPSA